MSNAHPSSGQPKRRGPGVPFGSGQPVPKSPGRTPVPPEVRAVQRRVVADLVGELKAAADLAVDALTSIVENPKAKDSDRIAAASQILDRSFGKPTQGIVGEFSFNGADRVTPDMLRAAALQVAGRYAEDAA